MRSRRRWSSLSALVRATLRQEEWMTVREAAALYRVTDETMLAWVRAGAFPMQVEEGRTWVARAALEAALHRMPERRSDSRDRLRAAPDAPEMPGDPDSAPERAGRRP
ncbi:MAG: helix-turn-helix domain-containing protein [Roseiflexus sp.]|nr:helix-turn-helix domain-containing protein [Roseiflexus sp.]